MNRSDLIEYLANRKNLNIKAAEKVIQEIFNSMSEFLSEGNRIEVKGFGVFEIRNYAGRTGRNPKTGIEVTVAPKKLPFFKVGKELKRRIMGNCN